VTTQQGEIDKGRAVDALDERSLEPDCENCAGVCCVAHGFAKSADYAFAKPEGVPCRNLSTDFRCQIHTDLRDRGFSGCADYSCSGAGQKVTQVIFPSVDWRTDAGQAARLFATFFIVKELHEMIWALTKLAALCPDADLCARIQAKASELQRLTFQGEQMLSVVDVAGRKKENRELADLVEAARSGQTG
jgi:hypothetical protein